MITDQKPRIGMYWASSCGGCEIAFINIHEKILDVDAAFDFMFCPCLLDTKKAEIENLPDQSITLMLFNGAIRTKENEEMAHLLRRKSKVLVAFGSCASEGGIPGLANLSTREDVFRSVYLENTTTPNATRAFPQTNTLVPEGSLDLPEFLKKVKTLSQVTDVDFVIPGCPPEPHQLINVIELLYAAERMLELAMDSDITSLDVRRIPKKITRVGIGSVEAPRGTLTHHYECDERGLVTKVNMVVGTTNNHAPIAMSIARAAEKLITKGKNVEEYILNQIEMAFRLYDPCLSCATHALPGTMPLEAVIRDYNGAIIRMLKKCEDGERSLSLMGV